MSQEAFYSSLSSRHEENENYSFTASSQPYIEKDGWGEIYVNSGGKTIKMRDAVLLPNKALPWNWKWSDDGGMSHSPGIREKDLDHYILSLSTLPNTVILTTGRSGVLKVDPQRKEYLIRRGIKEVYILDTAKAIDKYKELSAKGILVAALIHTTC